MGGVDVDRLDAGCMLGRQLLRGCSTGELQRLDIGRPYVKGSDVYWENIVTRMLLQISALVLSVAVMSMKTLRVSRVIFE